MINDILIKFSGTEGGDKILSPSPNFYREDFLLHLHGEIFPKQDNSYGDPHLQIKLTFSSQHVLPSNTCLGTSFWAQDLDTHKSKKLKEK
jgi:hypothetical protein